MNTPKHFETAGGPWTNLAHIYCAQMDMAFKAAEPLMRAIGRAQLEWAQCAMARGRAWAALPGQLSQCKAPADVAGLQAQFWQTANRDYTEAGQRIWAATADFAKRTEKAGSETLGKQRDTLSVAENDSGEKRAAA